ncbi:hypothetical protein GGR10_000521 [Bartonella chomelii]|uniref:Uncharacterized protein n=1 Tax=Bartonella chomelii TaxID=236402 RepID=A0ABR6E4U6_9HYPH|nr:hypothetical protein [Bartonella chomelii]
MARGKCANHGKRRANNKYNKKRISNSIIEKHDNTHKKRTFFKCSFFLYFLIPHASLFYNILQRFFYFSILLLIYSIFILFNFYSTPFYSHYPHSIPLYSTFTPLYFIQHFIQLHHFHLTPLQSR